MPHDDPPEEDSRDEISIAPPPSTMNGKRKSRPTVRKTAAQRDAEFDERLTRLEYYARNERRERKRARAMIRRIDQKLGTSPDPENGVVGSGLALAVSNLMRGGSTTSPMVFAGATGAASGLAVFLNFLFSHFIK